MFTISHVTNQLLCTKIHHISYNYLYVHHYSLCTSSDAISLIILPYTHRHLGSRNLYKFLKKIKDFSGFQGPEFNGYLVGRGNSKDVDLNRNFPDLNALMYYNEKNNGQNHHFPLPDNWEHQVGNTQEQ